jgi:hypothetical protein
MKSAQALVDQLGSLRSDAPASLYGFLYISAPFVAPILQVLCQWSTSSGKSSAAFIAHNPQVFPPRPGPHSFADPMESMRKMMAMQMSLEDDEGADDSMPVRSRGTSSPFDDPSFEQDLYAKLRVLLPPEDLIHRHAALSGVIRGENASMGLASARKETNASWEPNPTLLVGHPLPSYSTHPYYIDVSGRGRFCPSAYVGGEGRLSCDLWTSTR